MTLLLALTALSLAPETRDSLLADTQGNEAMWSAMLATPDADRLACIEYLFTTIPRLDRLEMTETALMDHVMGALDSREYLQPGLPDSIFQPFLLDYRMSEEPVTAYRTPLSAHWVRELPEGLNLLETAEALREEVSGMTVRRRDYLGGISAPLDVLQAGAGTPTELRVLLGSSLRAMGIPVRPVLAWFQGEHGREAGWLEVWTGEDWMPLPLASDSIPEGFEGLSMTVAGTEQTTVDLVPCGTLLLSPPDSSEGDVLVWLSVEAPGRLIPLDWLEFDPMEPASLVLGRGRYLLQVTSRLENGTVRLWSRWIDIEAGVDTPIDLESIMREGSGGS